MNRPSEAPARIASTDDVDLALYHYGGSGPTLILCHATGLNATTYRPLLPRFTADFDVWALDFRGHGASTAPTSGSFAWTGFADDLLAVVDHIGADSVRAFGHSMGGATILLAEKQRPGVIEAAWLYEPIVFPPDFTPRNSMMAEAASKRRSEFPSKAEALLRFASRPPLGLLRADALASYVDGGFVETSDGTVTLACRPEYEAATFKGAGTKTHDIAGLELHTIVASGRILDDPDPAEFAGPAAAVLPNGFHVEYEGLGHFGPLQDPDRIANDAATFLAAGSSS